MEIEETRLPGIGLRHDFVTAQGRRIGVLSQRNGARQVAVYDRFDPDACSDAIDLTPDEAEVLAELLGAPRVTERLARLRDQVEALATEGIPIEPGSRYVGATLGDTAIRTRTGASVVAVLRGDEMVASPTPDFRFQADDRLVVVGTQAGVDAVRGLLSAP
ncbi:cation:proton antiporter regulatory subunit [Geodermatophilus sp. SYSU D00691]